MDRLLIFTIYSVRFDQIHIGSIRLKLARIGERKAIKTGGVVMPCKKKHNKRMSEPKVLNHKLHIFLSVISGGFWLPIYGLLYLITKRTGSTVESRKEQFKKAVNAEAQRSQQKKSKGYKKGSGFTSVTWALECNHLIRAKVGMGSRNSLRGKTVFCDICQAERTVIANPRMM
jgi:hypothetical protein